MFLGFSERTVDFLWGIRLNNEKAWFEAHRQDYLNDLYNPLRDLALEVTGAFSDRHPELGLDLHISRIYRDARRLHGRGPYKDHLWFSFRRDTEEDWTGTPVFWFEITPEGWGFGLGCYSAKASTMAKHRARIDRHPEVLAALVEELYRQSLFVLDGPDYHRPKGDPGPLLAPWYNKKTLSLSCDRTHDGVSFSRELVGMLTEGYESLLPFYRYFITLDGGPDPRY